MRLFLDSAYLPEIEQAFAYGLFDGLTTTPTFMHRHGVRDIDSAIVQMSKIVPELQVEALGETASEIIAEAERLSGLPTDKPLIYKVPISLEGAKACKILTEQGKRVNVHLVYTLNQAYMALNAGAAYICPLVGRLHDQGHDSFALIEQIVEVIENYGYDSEVMVSSVRHAEHVRQALLAGAHVCTVPWPVVKQLTLNSLTDVGAAQFFEHTRLLTVRVRDVIRPANPVCKVDQSLQEAAAQMSASGFGAVTVTDTLGKVAGILTDGDLRRTIAEQGAAGVNAPIGQRMAKNPVSIEVEAILNDAVALFKERQIDVIIVTENDAPVGMLDVQDVVKLGLMG